jgi:hypothetical protein
LRDGRDVDQTWHASVVSPRPRVDNSRVLEKVRRSFSRPALMGDVCTPVAPLL